ncbi:bifunctional phosphoribosylaminoimidazolecarboxamide formyltransferase/IMP cyclohydrolase [Texcoconibacillus texcoconensis]|uniref:Bifunctional purine biosynthesis protein PurH n=1 Tax=Texcoconibacillus texcoconensis TaxID=1095777 RepID=A0A840QMG1_9BACI|nr:bifunctional phosphoribosylaminoimidazolecarboxamide formyltransferase/IMP cyclohydrolase [Texcoconibacillus texcoconensis]MBB5172557.1 phosphoribosylaminoimidazolecarboxamide formyltransferase/IMP cyclohydrolase [Texcoconibacillus texcoconensis]
MKKRALVSVSNKEGILPLMKTLADQEVEIISTGGTKAIIEEAGIPVTSVSDVTGFPEILDGRVKTLHPFIHGGLLAMRGNDQHVAQLEEQQITTIDYVIVNLYPFEETVSKPGATFEDAIENIDIGGPAMVRAAAKNHQDIAVIVDPNDYEAVIEEIKANDEVSKQQKRKLAAKAYRHTASYDALIAEYMTAQTEDEEPESLTVTYRRKQSLRYGENPHQQASFYQRPLSNLTSIANATQLHGKELSYNNINDADAALAVVRDFQEPAVSAIKHMNPCGVGVADTVSAAFKKAYDSDPVSIFGGIVAANREIDVETAQQLKEIFLEIVVAPSFTDEAMAILTEKKNIRLLTVEFQSETPLEQRITTVSGGALVQDTDTLTFADVDVKTATEREPSDSEWQELKLAWNVVKHVKSNAIVLAKDGQTIGVGAGQMNRVGSAKIAAEQAGERAKGSVMGSDAFFPMNDTVEAAAEAGVTAIIQPGGSKRDQDSIDKANELGIAMVFTGVRHFKH